MVEEDCADKSFEHISQQFDGVYFAFYQGSRVIQKSIEVKLDLLEIPHHVVIVWMIHQDQLMHPQLKGNHAQRPIAHSCLLQQSQTSLVLAPILFMQVLNNNQIQDGVPQKLKPFIECLRRISPSYSRIIDLTGLNRHETPPGINAHIALAQQFADIMLINGDMEH